MYIDLKVVCLCGSAIYYKLGVCYKKIGSAEKARYNFEKVKQLSPLSFEARMGASSGTDTLPVSARYGQPKDKGTAKDLSAADNYSVQIGSFKNKRNAERMMRKAAGAGYDSYVETIRSSGDDLFRVKVGRYSTKEDAERAAGKLKKQGYSTRICNNDVCQ